MLKKMLCLAVVLMAAHSTAWATITPVNSLRSVQARVNSTANSDSSNSTTGTFNVNKTAGNPPYTQASASQNTTMDPEEGHLFGTGNAAVSLISQPNLIQDELAASSSLTYLFSIDAPYHYDLSVDLLGLGFANSPSSPPMSGSLFASLNRIDVFQSIAFGEVNKSGVLAPGTYSLTMFASAFNITDDDFIASVVGPSPDTGLFNSFSFDLKLTPTPEPATFVLVGLAGAGLLLRRRRVA